MKIGHDRRRSSSTSACARRSRTCGRRATSSRSRTGCSMLPIRGLTGSHAYAQGRTAAFNAAGARPRLRPGLGPVGHGRRRLHDRRLLDRRDARHRDGRPVRASPRASASRARATTPGATRTHVKLLAEPDTLRLIGGQIHGGEGVKERCGLPRVRGQARRDARGPGVDGEHLLAADRRAVRADRDRRPERPGGARGRATDQPGATAAAPPPAPGPGVSGLIAVKQRLREHAEHHLRARRDGRPAPRPPGGHRPRRYRDRSGGCSGAACSCRCTGGCRGRSRSARCTRCKHDRRALAAGRRRRAAPGEPWRPPAPPPSWTRLSR